MYGNIFSKESVSETEGVRGSGSLVQFTCDLFAFRCKGALFDENTRREEAERNKLKKVSKYGGRQARNACVEGLYARKPYLSLTKVRHPIF